MQIHIITPFHRVENKEFYETYLAPLNILWHPISDVQVSFHGDWIFPLQAYPPKEWDPCYWKLNYFLDNVELIDDDYYCIMMDDDAYDDGFFDAIRKLSQHDLIVVSMKRGFRLPYGIHLLPSVQRHHFSTLTGLPSEMRVCGMGSQQLIIRGRLLRPYRFDNIHYSDGIYASYFKAFDPHFEPELYVRFNYLEPGRWEPLPVSCK